MAEPFLSEIRIFSFNFPPRGWAFCNGQLLPINQNQALFSLLGTTYGGNGQTNFALPNLKRRSPIHFGSGHTLGESAGQDAHTINIQELPEHSHNVVATSSIQNTVVPTNNYLASSTPSSFYNGSSNAAALPGSLSNIGGSQPHNNLQPSLVLNFCIALQGIFPSHN
jgi:microcystin-dependent protein